MRKYPELDDWGLMLVAEPSAADLILTVDKTALNYIFTITDRRFNDNFKKYEEGVTEEVRAAAPKA